MKLKDGTQVIAELLSEKEFQAQVRAVAQCLGWTVFCTWNSRHSPAGEPDLRMVRSPRVIFAKLKSAKGRITPKQREALAMLKECPGIECYLWRPSNWDEIEEVLG